MSKYNIHIGDSYESFSKPQQPKIDYKAITDGLISKLRTGLGQLKTDNDATKFGSLAYWADSLASVLQYPSTSFEKGYISYIWEQLLESSGCEHYEHPVNSILNTKKLQEIGLLMDILLRYGWPNG